MFQKPDWLLPSRLRSAKSISRLEASSVVLEGLEPFDVSGHNSRFGKPLTPPPLGQGSGRWPLQLPPLNEPWKTERKNAEEVPQLDLCLNSGARAGARGIWQGTKCLGLG